MSQSKRNQPGKTALVLAGGGLAGAVYEIGALRAIDDLLIDRTVNDFDMFIGTSAGALIAALLANEVSPELMLQVLDGDRDDLPTIERRDLLALNYRDWLVWAQRLPRKLFSAWLHYLRHIGDMGVVEMIELLGEALPSGVFDGMSLDRYVRRVIAAAGGSNRFYEIPHELCVIATDLDSGQRTVFCRHERADVPISLAVAASTALPVLYKPVRIHGHEYLDGGLRGTASIDLAIEHGAKLVICINPLVPFDNTERRNIPFLGPDGGYLSDKGFDAVAAQVSRIGIHAGLHYHIKQLRRSHPDVDIILIEPRANDYQMFFYNIMRYSSRLIVARHGFESVTLDLAEDYPSYRDALARHGIPISRRLVAEELTEIQKSKYDPEVIRHVLEARSFAYRRRREDTSVGRLSRALDDLDAALAALEEEPAPGAG
jgi:NTE family protein